MTEDINKNGLDKAPPLHEAYVRQEIVKQIIKLLEPFYICPLCHYTFSRKHLIPHLMWLKDHEHTISSLQLHLEQAGNDGQTDEESQYTQFKVKDTTDESEAMKRYLNVVLEEIEKFKNTK